MYIVCMQFKCSTNSLDRCWLCTGFSCSSNTFHAYIFCSDQRASDLAATSVVEYNSLLDESMFTPDSPVRARHSRAKTTAAADRVKSPPKVKPAAQTTAKIKTKSSKKTTRFAYGRSHYCVLE